VHCEHICPGIEHAERGDKKRLDFYAAKDDSSPFAIEVKWAKTSNPRITRDTEKLTAFCEHNQNAIGFLLLFGRKSVMDDLDIGEPYREWGKRVEADFRKTKYICRVFRVVC
jgi:hypothetical protein